MLYLSELDDVRESRRLRKNEAARDWREKNREKIRTRERLRYARNPDPKRRQSRESCRARSLKTPRWWIERKYNITKEQWDALFESQNFCCAVCGSPDPKTKHGWQTDHCHATGKVRGILCYGCNTAAGAMRDDATAIKKLASYIERFRGKIVAEGRLE